MVEVRRRAGVAVLGLGAVFAVLASQAPASAQTAQDPEIASETGEIQEGAQPGDDSFYCRERKLGQWFYCTKPRTPPKARPQASAPAPATSAAERLAAIAKQLDELKAKAILEPTEANIIAYVRFQREQLDRASTFSDTWQRALWQNPDIDYTLQRPVGTLGKRAWTDNRTADRARVLASLGERYGIFYFYAGSCTACDVFAPILRSVADTHRMSVMAVSMDGTPSRQFPGAVTDRGQRARMGVPGTANPALVLFDTQTRQTMPIGFGIMSADEIMERIFVLTNTRVGSDY